MESPPTPTTEVVIFCDARIGGDYFCEKCTYTSGNLNLLKKHIKSKHEEPRHLCDQCDYRAAQKGNLRLHIKVYTRQMRGFIKGFI